MSAFRQKERTTYLGEPRLCCRPKRSQRRSNDNRKPSWCHLEKIKSLYVLDVCRDREIMVPLCWRSNIINTLQIFMRLWKIQRCKIVQNVHTIIFKNIRSRLLAVIFNGCNEHLFLASISLITVVPRRMRVEKFGAWIWICKRRFFYRGDTRVKLNASRVLCSIVVLFQ